MLLLLGVGGRDRALNTPAGAASGSLTLKLNGTQATITETTQGLGATPTTPPPSR